MIPGLKERLTKEIREIMPESYDIEVITSPERRYSAWIGGSILATN